MISFLRAMVLEAVSNRQVLRFYLMSAVLAGPAASGTPSVIGFLHFSTGFGHFDPPIIRG